MVPQELVAGVRLELGDAVARAPGDHLLVQRDIGHVVDRRGPALLQQHAAFGQVGFLAHRVGDLVELLVRVAAVIERRARNRLAGGVGRHGAVQEVHRVPRIVAARRPAQQIEAGFVLLVLAEQHRVGLGVQVDLDADARQHALHGDADRLVVDVAVVRAVELHLEAVGIAGVGQKLLGRVGIERQALEGLVPAREPLGHHQAEPIARGDDLVAAHTSARQAVYKLPNEPRSWSMYEDVFGRFPVVLVGVTELANAPDIRAAENWSARRVGSMLQRQLVDLVGLGDEGGRYEFADGRIVPLDEFGLSYRLEILPQSTPGKPTMTSMDLARRLVSLVREDSSEFYFPLAKVVESISIVDKSTVDIRLRQPFARFESLLRVPYQSTQSDRGVYSQQKSSENAQFFNPVDIESSQSRLPIVERQFSSASFAADALLAGEIDVLDRVYPADLQRLRSNEAVAVRPYLIPSVHILIPNQRTHFMKDQVYRRSLLYAVDRDRIVKQIICGGQDIPGYSTISGPLPTGSDENDLIGYGYNERVQVVEFNVAMSIVSPLNVLGKLRKEARKKLLVNRRIELDGIGEIESYKMLESWLDQDEAIKEPTLIVAHPATEIARVTCQAMQQMWIAVGRKVELRQLPPGVTRPTDDDYDLLYAEFTIEEPLVDIRRVLGELGLAKQISPTIGQLIWELDTARNWVQSRQILRQIHEQCSAEVTVLPLWQTINFYAFRKNVQGLGESQVRLYDNVDKWMINRRIKE